MTVSFPSEHSEQADKKDSDLTESKQKSRLSSRLFKQGYSEITSEP
jgi:hypothetical protein